MSILNLLKEKTADEKQNFLNSIRSKASSKLKNTDDNKILDVISIVDAFNSSLSINSLVEQSSCVPKQNIVLPTEILGQGNVFDNKEEFDETVRIIKKYYKTNFRV